jgi:hypothetical protein
VSRAVSSRTIAVRFTGKIFFFEHSFKKKLKPDLRYPDAPGVSGGIGRNHGTIYCIAQRTLLKVEQI